MFRINMKEVLEKDQAPLRACYMLPALLKSLHRDILHEN